MGGDDQERERDHERQAAESLGLAPPAEHKENAADHARHEAKLGEPDPRVSLDGERQECHAAMFRRRRTITSADPRTAPSEHDPPRGCRGLGDLRSQAVLAKCDEVAVEHPSTGIPGNSGKGSFICQPRRLQTQYWLPVRTMAR